MTEEGKRRWTLILMREGQVNSRTLAMSRGKVLAFGGLALVALAAAFFAAGKWVGDLASRGHVEALEAEVLDLQEENAAMAVVAERVERLELPFNRYGVDPYGIERAELVVALDAVDAVVRSQGLVQEGKI